MTSSSQHPAVGKVSDLLPNSNKAVEIGGKSVLLCRGGDIIYAVENKCSHTGAPLEGGRVRGHFLFCPLHAARFDLRDGTTGSSLTKVPICTYAVKVLGDDILVEIGPAEDLSSGPLQK